MSKTVQGADKKLSCAKLSTYHVAKVCQCDLMFSVKPEHQGSAAALLVCVKYSVCYMMCDVSYCARAESCSVGICRHSLWRHLATAVDECHSFLPKIRLILDCKYENCSGLVLCVISE